MQFLLSEELCKNIYFRNRDQSIDIELIKLFSLHSYAPILFQYIILLTLILFDLYFRQEVNTNKLKILVKLPVINNNMR